MKKLLILTAFALFAKAGIAQQVTAAAPAVAKADAAIASFDNQNFDFGKIKQGTPATHEFKFTNTGKVPMVITNVQASCGCTTPDWSKEPILPGGSGFVKATYNAAGIGAFDKSVTVTANVEASVIVLRIHGEVIQTNQ
ncbi:MAG: DUF1573 domain-containing protein [Cyclobacteriaceae bacterium]|nr:DUF1573 domain-containing protein [Cyclobacteriaceae bacterium]